mgnify:CR=1 FL=1
MLKENARRIVLMIERGNLEIREVRTSTLDDQTQSIAQAEADADKPVEFLRIAKEIANYHHEKWDGSGYPLGLAGNDIPISARLMALADVFDALSCARVYKPAFPLEEARSMIVNGSGTHFDPDIVAAFDREFDSFKRIAKFDFKAALEEFQYLNPNDPGSWPLIPKAVILVGVFILILVMGWLLFWGDQWADLEAKQQEEQTLKQDYLVKKRSALPVRKKSRC